MLFSFFLLLLANLVTLLEEEEEEKEIEELKNSGSPAVETGKPCKSLGFYWVVGCWKLCTTFSPLINCKMRGMFVFGAGYGNRKKASINYHWLEDIDFLFVAGFEGRIFLVISIFF